MNKSYNDYMIILSMASASAVTASSAYSSFLIAPVTPKQESSRSQNPLSDLSPNGEINDTASISNEAKALLAAEKSDTQDGLSDQGKQELKDTEKSQSGSPKSEEELTPNEKQQVAELKSRDAEVKTHEQAHISAAAGIGASAPTYTYKTGPDGKKYAVGGEVNIRISQGDDPEVNIEKAKIMKAAALAPAQPSGQDLSVAREAEEIITKSSQDLSQKKAESAKADDKSVETKK